jgi:hypothetical protein
MKCDECKYWEQLDTTTLEVGKCRINAPSINRAYPFDLALWPKTKHTDWCGDFWAKDESPLEFLQGGERRSATCDY